jgi:hypothetical protein
MGKPKYIQCDSSIFFFEFQTEVVKIKKFNLKKQKLHYFNF